MLFQRALFALAGLVSLATASPFWPLSPRLDSNVCLPGQDITIVYVVSNVVIYPVFINQTFEYNTVIYIGGTTINVYGPTYISTVFQATITTESTSTMTATT